ncbi:alpha-amylase family protein [Paenibacillus ginsengarvi]|uniref:Beta-galactosidase trimerisation domain-containing protein n=1 Tax=Paenibacillus ginsengarvi TaxID=400777 RepID=A0A3B0BT07_9BACL|nr:alpha-amylase family protein [Paenibacillus ginsengarvi]RKN76052.1 hypothetical protein D7M11_24970 [Paenibacillus ginsengarvi]
MGNDLYRRTFRRGLFDFHAGEAVPEVELNVAEYVAAAARAGMQTITFMTKDAFGNSYFGTKIGHKNARVKGDMLAEAIQEARKHGIDIIAYYNVGLNSHVAAANPDYRQRTADQKPITEAFGYYDLLCMNSPYRDHVYAQFREIAENYPVSGFFFDITYVWSNCCHCEYCSSLYKSKYGQPIPQSPAPGTPELKRWQSFQRDIRYQFLRDAAACIKGINPDLLIGWNHAGDPRFGQVEADRHADYFTSEFHPPHYAYGSLLARWKRSFRKPFELMMPSEMGSWGEWTVAPAATLRTTAAIAVANGGSISYGHVAYPSGFLKGRVPDAVMEAIGESNEWVRSLEPWLEGAESVPIVAVLYSIAGKRVLEASALPSPGDDPHLQGLHRILTEGHIHFDIIDEEALLSQLSRYRLLILPDQAYLSDEAETCIRDFVRAGGRLVASNRTSLYDADGTRKSDFGLADVLGIGFTEVSRYSVSYVYPIDAAIAGSIPDMPILLKDTAQKTLRIEAREGATVLAKFTDPALEAKTFRHVYHQHAHPAFPTPFPAVVSHSYGSGASLYFAGPIESAFWRTGSPWLRTLYLNGLNELDPDPLVKVEAPISVEVSVMRQSSRLVVHLTNVREDKAAGSKTFIEEIAPVTNIRVSVKTSAERVYIAPDNTELPFEKEEGRIRFVVAEVGLHAAVVIEGADL